MKFLVIESGYWTSKLKEFYCFILMTGIVCFIFPVFPEEKKAISLVAFICLEPWTISNDMAHVEKYLWIIFVNS